MEYGIEHEFMGHGALGHISISLIFMWQQSGFVPAKSSIEPNQGGVVNFYFSPQLPINLNLAK